MTRYVSHHSGVGQKFRVKDPCEPERDCWFVESIENPPRTFHLPKSEYHLTDPPAPRTRWIDVGHECHVLDEKTVIHGGRVVVAVVEQTRYRVRLVAPGVFIIEHEESTIP